MITIILYNRYNEDTMSFLEKIPMHCIGTYIKEERRNGNRRDRASPVQKGGHEI
ncbi:hypothetical protein [Dethiothermospora halolimnae]|uniref:hypothetical protein n=1 Tax=Dethiothermospora halolimnae TaxID=3114390 RepID=UPI003CCBF387